MVEANKVANWLANLHKIEPKALPSKFKSMLCLIVVVRLSRGKNRNDGKLPVPDNGDNNASAPRRARYMYSMEKNQKKKSHVLTRNELATLQTRRMSSKRQTLSAHWAPVCDAPSMQSNRRSFLCSATILLK
jgi:hypothetical protein